MKSYPVSANVEFVKKITSSEQLKQKTNMCVLDIESKEFYIYRDSSQKPGWLSREIYTIENSELKFREKDAIKYEPKEIPSNTYSYEYDSIKIYSVNKLDDEQLKNIKKNLDSIANK